MNTVQTGEICKQILLYKCNLMFWVFAGFEHFFHQAILWEVGLMANSPGQLKKGTQK